MGKIYFDDDYFVHVNVQNNDFDDGIDGGDCDIVRAPEKALRGGRV